MKSLIGLFILLCLVIGCQQKNFEKRTIEILPISNTFATERKNVLSIDSQRNREQHPRKIYASPRAKENWPHLDSGSRIDEQIEEIISERESKIESQEFTGLILVICASFIGTIWASCWLLDSLDKKKVARRRPLELKQLELNLKE